MKRNFLKYLLGIMLFLASVLFIVWFHYNWIVYPYAYYLDEAWLERDAFRSFSVEEGTLERLSEKAEEFECTKAELMTILMVENGYHLKKKQAEQMTKNQYSMFREQMEKRNSIAFYRIQNAYAALLEDIKYFPVPESNSAKVKMPVFENSWGEERTYGGERTHEGCDIMGMEYASGFYPVISVSDGVVEQMGWLEQGGWRIGIRSEHGAYFYYAHLSEYAIDMEVGKEVRAGQLLGYMGDTGYGVKEGTSGNFPVHLHFGIYIQTPNYEELSINPYFILRYLENFHLKWNYASSDKA